MLYHAVSRGPAQGQYGGSYVMLYTPVMGLRIRTHDGVIRWHVMVMVVTRVGGVSSVLGGRPEMVCAGACCSEQHTYSRAVNRDGIEIALSTKQRMDSNVLWIYRFGVFFF